MSKAQTHITRCLLAGIVAILPVGGTVLMVAYLEVQISDAGLTKLPFYFPGFCLLSVVLIIYFVVLGFTTFVIIA